MAEDISNKTIVVLVVLTVIISVLGTFVVLNEVSNLEKPNVRTVVSDQTTQQGRVSLEILPNEEPLTASTTGHVTFEILP